MDADILGMNIFYLDADPKLAAQYHNDKHVVKMILETAQLLCTALHEHGIDAPYRATHRNHPSSIWARSSIQHYRWLLHLGLELCEEYTHRYGRVHKTEDILLSLDEPPLADNGFSQPPQAMPNQYKCDDSIEAYRKYYIGDKETYMVTHRTTKEKQVRYHTYTNRDKPHWRTDGR